MIKQDYKDFAEATSYITPMKYVSGRILEYDIASANITMLRKYGKIDDNYYNYLRSIPKQNREIEIGLKIRSDNSFYQVIKQGITEAKMDLFQSNNIDPNSIVRIANDAVYINSSRDLAYTKFGDVEFKLKSINSSMIKLDKLIIFFLFNQEGINIDVKGINQTSQLLHADFLLSAIAECIYLVERVSTKDALEFVTNLFEDYVKLKLPIQFYRELTPESLYHLKDSNFYLTYVDSINNIDINYNLYIIRELFSIILDKYNSESRR